MDTANLVGALRQTACWHKYTNGLLKSRMW
jgi:hypothetical protein